MSAYSFENKKLIPVWVLRFHFAYGKMKTAIVLRFNKEPDFSGAAQPHATKIWFFILLRVPNECWE